MPAKVGKEWQREDETIKPSPEDLPVFIGENVSVLEPLPRDYESSVVDSNGVFFALHVNADGDVELYKGTEPGGLEKIHAWTGLTDGENNKIAVHKTAAGSILVGCGNNIYRSTDGGDTFSSVKSGIGGSSIWSFTENSGGTILATGGGGTSQEIYESTDDGQSWSVLADSADLPFTDHVHKIMYHPANDYIIVTGGDGDDGYARSTDGGTTWDAFDSGLQHEVGIGVHPTDGTVHLVGIDVGTSNGEIYKANDDGSASIAINAVLQCQLADPAKVAAEFGTFSIRTLKNPNGRSFYILTSINAEPETDFLTWVSYNLTGEHWRIIGSPDSRVQVAMKEAGAYGSIIDISNHPKVILSDCFVHAQNAHEFKNGVPAEVPVDRRETYGDIVLREADHRIDGTKATDHQSLLASKISGGTKYTLYQKSGWDTITWRNADTGTDLLYLHSDGRISLRNSRLEVNSLGDGIRVVNAENLSGKTGLGNEIRIDDGTNTTSGNNEPCMWQPGPGQWVSLVDGTTFT